MTATRQERAAADAPGGPDAAWRVLATVSLALTATALATMLTTLVPPQFGVVEWEFGAMADVAAAVPLLAAGLGGLLAAAIARRQPTLRLAVALVVVGVILFLALLLFVPAGLVALRNAELGSPAIVPNVRRLMSRTIWSQAVGIAGCVLGAAAAFRHHAGTRA